MASTESKIAPEVILNLKDRLKHGQNVTKILESQLDTAQQNISLLQGQVRLANETIMNLKKHFQETENILSQLMSPVHQPSPSRTSFEMENKDSDTDSCQRHVDSTTRSPPPENVVSTSRSFDERNDKSPYAIQLKQVLDVLDEEPRRAVVVHHPELSSTKECSCSDCQTPRKHYNVDCDCGSSSCSSEHYHRKSEEYCKAKQKSNGHHVMSPKSYTRSESHTGHSQPYGSRCTGPCCTNGDLSGYKMMEKSPGPVHYVSIHSPDKHSERHHHGHCGEKCQSHAYVNYVPYGYHVVDNGSGVSDTLPPMSPSTRRKRSYVPLLPGEEPPHLKYTKVKRIDGSKLTAQKLLQDFTKRRFMPYNPKYDLDLLIVPPPLPAIDLLKGGSGRSAIPKQSYIPLSPRLYRSTNIRDDVSLEHLSGIDNAQEGLSNGGSNDTNNNNTESSGFYSHGSFKSSSISKPLTIIKEERKDGHKLEDHINKLRHETNATRSLLANNSNQSSHNYYEQDFHSPISLKQERTISPAGGK